MISLTGFLLSSAVFAFVYYFFLKDAGKKYPKGPFPWPIIGNLLELKNGPHKQYGKWAKEYGPIYQMYMGKNRAYVISDLKAIREAFNDPYLSDRPNLEVMQLLRGGPYGVVVTSGQAWSEQRRFTLRHLRDFGFGKMAGEEMISAEVKEFLSTLANDAGKDITVSRTFNAAVMNTVWTIATGNRYPQDDPRLWGIFNAMKRGQEAVGRAPAVMIMPSLAKAFPKALKWESLLQLVDEVKSILNGHVDEHLETYSENEVPRDFIDVYIAEIKKTTDENSSFYKEHGIKSLRGVMADFFIAGSETVSVTLSWAVLYLSKFPEVQKKLQNELDSVVGRNRNPTLADRPSLPYTEATIAETLRYSSIVPIGVIHAASKDTKVMGYDCPKGTQIIANLYYIHHNEELFPEPEKFKPERFLGPDGKFKKMDALIAFGFGKRACLGETLARDEIFLFLTSMFHRFNIRLADNSKDASLEPMQGLLMGPKDYQVVLTERD